VTIHLPGNAQAPANQMDTFVRAVGPDVTNFEVGDVVVCSVKDLQNIGTFDAGNGVKMYGFIEEGDVFGKFESK